MLELGHVLLGRALLREDQGSMNLASNTAPVCSTIAVQGRRHPARDTGGAHARWTSLTTWPVLRSYQRRFRSSVAHAELDDEVAGQVLGLGFAALLPPQAEQGRLIAAHDDPGIRAANDTNTD